MSGTWAHDAYDELLTGIVDKRKITPPRVADVLTRLLVAPGWPSQSEIAQGTMLQTRSKTITQDTVSRVITALADWALVQLHEPVADRPGRPYKPVQLGSPRWAMVGVKIVHQDGKAQKAHILVTELDGQPIVLSEGSQSELLQLTDEVSLVDEDVVDVLGTRIETICNLKELRCRLILGVGLDVAGHVFDGVVIDGLTGQMDPVPLGEQLSKRLISLSQRLVDAKRMTELHPFPVMVDNDLHVLGVLETYQPRFPDRDFLVAAVFDTGIGSAPIVGNRVYRGARGMSGEIGHFVVPVDAGELAELARLSPRRTGDLPGFLDACDCMKGGVGHLDCYATPTRILGQLGESTFSTQRFAHLATTHAGPDYMTRVFELAGSALGTALSGVINFFDPSLILLYLPPVLAAPPSGSNGASYWQAALKKIHEVAFSDSAKNVEIALKPLPANERVYLGAKAAAIRVIDSLIQHARGRCKCYQPTPRPPASGPTPVDDLVSLR